MSCITKAQQPGVSPDIVAEKYARTVSHKIQTYENRINRKTEKTLLRLCKWETKIQSVLRKASPDAEQKLFGNDQLTFTRLLEQYRAGGIQLKNHGSRYDGYLDSLTTITRYLSARECKPATDAYSKAQSLSETTDRTQYIQSFIKERKKLLISETMHYAGKSPLLRKISKESYYYAATLENYKELFSERDKAEQALRKALNELPAFRKFMQQNSRLASLFRMPATGGSAAEPAAALAGLQTRAGVQSMIEDRIRAGGPNAAAQVRQNLQEAQSKLSEIKDKLLKGGTLGSGGEVEMPDFKPNSQRTKTFAQRIEYGFDMQFSGSHSVVPSATDLGLRIGYKLNDRSAAGVGVSYKLGLGSIDRIRLSSEGVGLRSYLDWKIKGQWYAAGGYELNYMSAFKEIADLKEAAWQRSALIGIGRQYKAGKKMKGEVKVLYDFLAGRSAGDPSPIKFRMGYKF